MTTARIVLVTIVAFIVGADTVGLVTGQYGNWPGVLVLVGLVAAIIAIPDRGL